MGSRTKSPDRCEDCQVRRALCICPLMPRFDLKTKVIILIHHRETRRPTNSGRLSHLILKNSEMRVRGVKGSPMDSGGLLEPGRQSILLFPTLDADDLTSEKLKRFEKPLTLIVPDGNWRQASKMPNRIPELAQMPRFKIPLERRTEYRLRAENRVDGLATLEAIARALGVIEGLEVQKKMEDIFRLKVERTLWARAKISADECTGGIPDEAWT